VEQDFPAQVISLPKAKRVGLRWQNTQASAEGFTSGGSMKALFAELKNQIWLRRLWLRRLKFVREQFFLAAAARRTSSAWCGLSLSQRHLLWQQLLNGTITEFAATTLATLTDHSDHRVFQHARPFTTSTITTTSMKKKAAPRGTAPPH